MFRLTVGQAVMLLMDGYSEHLTIDPVQHEGNPAVLVTFNPDSKYQKSQLMLQGKRGWYLTRLKPNFLRGVMEKDRNVHIELEPAIEQDLVFAG